MKWVTKTATAAIILLALFSAVAFAQQKGSFTDPRDKKKYATVKIGTQTWMAQNLNYSAYGSACYGEYGESAHGESAHVLSAKETQANCAKYGRLYTYSSAFALACPVGWRLPEKEEWDALITAAGGADSAGKALKAKSGWSNRDDGTSGNGTDKLGFAALPGGGFYDGRSEDFFSNIGIEGYWWSGNKGNPQTYSISTGDGMRGGNSRLESVRCIQGEPSAEAKAMAAEFEAQAKAEAEAKAKADSIAKAEAAIAKARADSIAKAEKAEKDREAKIKANSGTFTDSRDKRAYKTIKIGGKTWLAENLDYADKDSKCYNNNPDGCKRYGRLYSWESAMLSCPKGWHLPTDAEWDALVAAAGGSSEAGSKLKAKSGWPYNNIIGTDEFGFSALPGGKSLGTGYSNAGDYGCWWSATESKDISKANYRRILSTANTASNIDDPKANKFSVRCLQGEPGAAEKKAIAKIEADAKAQPATQPKPAAQPAQQQSGGQEFCNIAMLKKCIAMPKGTCAMSGGKVVAKCP